jgi:two-component system CheB/CheR fusion protein
MPAQTELIRIILQLSQCKSLDEIVKVLRDSTRDLVGADGITIVLRDGEKCFYAEENAIGPLWKGKRFPMSACISGWCMIHRRQVVIKDIYVDERIPHDAYRPTFVKSLAMTPIRVANPIGAIGAYWGSSHEATETELSILQALGDSAAMALENATLFETLTLASRRKDDFISMLAHELRNPLAPIQNCLSLLQMNKNDTGAVEIMERQILHLSHIVEDLLDVARINNGKVMLRLARMDLAALLRQIVEDHRVQFEACGVTLLIETPDRPAWMDADATRLTQVISNLLDNARKYTPRGGRVAVRMLLDPVLQQARIDVEDTGMGITPGLLSHIFEAFTQADTSLARTSGGLGLGLTVASGLVKLHQGSITATSEGTGHGSRFTVTLPGVEFAKGNAAMPKTPAAAPKNLRLLIIEDNADTAQSLQKLMNACGYRTSVAYDGHRGIEMARAEKPDVILSDIGLPVMDGYALAAALRSSPETASVRLIAVSGYGSEEDRRRSREAGFDAHLTKPIDLQELIAAMSAPQYEPANSNF